MTSALPLGLRAISEYAHSLGVRTIVWFEPEHHIPGWHIYENRPEWLIGPAGGSRLLDLGNENVRNWITDHIDKLITDERIDLYRQDFNILPLDIWRRNDSKERQGVTEIKYVMGYLAFLDELRRRHPDMLIDSCASGGNRNDLETLRRAVPLLRSDYIFEPVGQQCHSYGLSLWIPYYGTPTSALDPYGIRSTMCPALFTCWDVRRNDLDYYLLRRLTGQWRKVSEYYYVADCSIRVIWP